MTPNLLDPRAPIQTGLSWLRAAARPNSLSLRLFLAAAIWSLIALPATGVLLLSLFRKQVEADFDQRLNVFLTTLIAESIDLRASLPQRPQDMVEPLFKQPLTGWYWQVKPVGASNNAVKITSESLLSEELRLPRETGVKPDTKGLMWANLIGPDRERLRVVEREMRLGDAEDQHPYSYAVAGPRAEIDNSVREFRNLLTIALTIIGVGLIGATLAQIYYGLRPLARIERGLAAIRSGEAERLEGDLPSEIVPLQQELNALIGSNQAIIERARTQVGNLAHALKTPLSVITNEARDDKGPFAAKVSEQAEVMRIQVTHYLDRARLAARVGVIGGVTGVEPVAESIERALTRIYKGIDIAVDCPEGAKFQGEKQDLEEMLGNLMDNACKWAKSEVVLTVGEDSATGRPGGRRLKITIDDDGPGLTSEQRAQVGKRGRRLDETKPGSGLGLSIVADIAGLYRGAFRLDRSPKGGLRAELDLPAA